VASEALLICLLLSCIVRSWRMSRNYRSVQTESTSPGSTRRRRYGLGGVFPARLHEGAHRPEIPPQRRGEIINYSAICVKGKSSSTFTNPIYHLSSTHGVSMSSAAPRPSRRRRAPSAPLSRLLAALSTLALIEGHFYREVERFFFRCGIFWGRLHIFTLFPTRFLAGAGAQITFTFTAMEEER
jgi:hypothetical protein